MRMCYYINMKKSWKKRFLAIILALTACFAFGCSDTDENGVAGDTDGVKVLSKPANYFDNPSSYLGEGISEYYYNIFAYHIVNNLYAVYEKNDIHDKINNVESPSDYVDIVSAEDEDQYYFRDSIRYTIKSVEDIYDLDGNLSEQKISLDLNAWKWSIAQDAGNGKSIIFMNYLNTSSLSESYEISLAAGLKTWRDIYTNKIIPDFSEYYFSKENPEIEGTLIKYYHSPYYEEKVLNQSVEAVNFFQDALEYVTYLFVLGFDYQDTDENGTVQPSEYAKLFDLSISPQDKKTVSDMTVKGWNVSDGRMELSSNANVSVVDALEIVKNLYKTNGTVVGLTEPIKEKVARYIKDYVIGSAAWERSQFEVALSETKETVTTSKGTLKFDRCYEDIVKNIIDYACDQAPIGRDGDNFLALGGGYMASQICDYPEDYFEPYGGTNSNGEIVEDFAFARVEAQEYQSLIINPKARDVGKLLSDIILVFEYYDTPNANLHNLDALEITIGMRYFSRSHYAQTGEYLADVRTKKPMVVRYGKYGTLVDEEGYDSTDESFFFFDSSQDIPETMQDCAVSIPNNIVIGSQFVSPAAIYSPLLPKKINGYSNMKDYFQTNEIPGVGTFGSLNPSKFVGDGGSDYIEVYFVVHKTAGDPFANYNFKVLLADFGCESIGY